jgi:hypothetical protein
MGFSQPPKKSLNWGIDQVLLANRAHKLSVRVWSRMAGFVYDLSDTFFIILS